MENQEIYLYQTFSPPQSIDTGPGFFPQAPGVTLSDGTILYTWRDDSLQTQSSGTGIFDPFLTVQNTGSESGTNFYTGSSYGTGDAISSSNNRTSSISASSIPIVEIGGSEYYEIRLDVNEVNGGQKSFIDLNSFKIYGSNSATQSSTEANLLYSLDTEVINRDVHLFDDNTGSGKSDLVILVPKSYFSSNPEYLYFEASLSGTDGGFEEFSVRVLDVLDPSLSINKIADVSSVDGAGDLINYTITVANAGNVTLTGVVLTDEFANATLLAISDTDSDGELDVGESWIYNASHTVTQAEMDAGDDITNLATVDTDQTELAQSAVATGVLQAPALTIAKVASVDVVDGAGDLINYSITVANAGNVTLTGVVLTDEFANATLLAISDTDSDGELDVGESWIYNASHTVTQAEMDAGDDITNLATVDTDQTELAQSAVATDVLQAPDLMIKKIANVDFVDEVGDVILYTISVENQGNTTLDGVTVDDPMLVSTLTNDADKDSIIDGDTNSNGTLDVNETWVWSGAYIVTETDINAARASSTPYSINNTAYADSNQTEEEQASETVKVQVNFEGLSHGYWKTHPSDWDGVGTTTSFENFFFGSQQSSLNWLISTGAKPNKLGTVSDITFEQALALKGGGAAALAREAVAAVLNVRDEDVTYRFTESQVKEWVSEALSNQAVDINNDGINEFSAGASAIIGVKNFLEENNNLELVG